MFNKEKSEIEVGPKKAVEDNLIFNKPKIVTENCYFGNRLHDKSGRFRCNKSHELGKVKLVLA